MSDDLNSFKCPACGGTLEFDSRSQKMKCPYCDTEVDVDAFKNQEQKDKEAASEQIDTETVKGGSAFSEQENAQMESYICESCGGQIVVQKGTGATSCPFCGNPHVVPKMFEGTLKPDFIVPFKLDKKAVKECYRRHHQGKHFLPAVFKDENHISEIKGVYVPYWLFSSRVRGNLVFRCVQVERWSDSDYDYVRRNYYDVTRKGWIEFENVPHDGSSQMDDTLMESIEPFDPKEGVDYQAAYLSGYAANRYDQDQEAVTPKVEERMKNSTKREFENTISGYDSVSLRREDIRFKKMGAKYVLYPVWLMGTNWRGKRYTFAMNGQTGRFVGNLPRDDAAFYRAFALIAAGLSVLFSVIAYVYLLSEQTGGCY